jgi:hypothetical protein
VLVGVESSAFEAASVVLEKLATESLCVRTAERGESVILEGKVGQTAAADSATSCDRGRPFRRFDGGIGRSLRTPGSGGPVRLS